MDINRKNLKGTSKHIRKAINIEEVYKELDAGKTVTQVAKELGVSRQTLYVRHREYQKQFEKKDEGFSLRNRLLESTDPRAEYIRKYHPEYLEED